MGRYSDTDGNLFEQDIEDLALRGLVGVPDGDPYRPDDPITRGENAAYVNRAMNYMGFPVPSEPPVEPPPPPPGTPYWSPDPANGTSDFSSVADSGRAAVITQPWGWEMWNYDVDGSHNAGIRLGWQNRENSDSDDIFNIPDGTYQADFLIPVNFDGESNVFQFKTRTRETNSRVMLTKISLAWNGTDYDVKLGTRIRSDGAWRAGSPDTIIVAPNAFPSDNQWHTFAVNFEWGTPGRHRLLVDGVELWDEQINTTPNNMTEYDYPKEFTVNHYLSNWQGVVNPSDSSINVRNIRVTE